MNTFIKQFITAISFSFLVYSPVLSASYFGAGVSRVDASASSGGADAGDANGFTIYGGQRMGNLGFEVGYLDVGDIDVPGSSIVITGSLLKFYGTFSTNASDNIVLFANAGIAVTDLKNNAGGKHDDSEFALMLGFDYKFSKQLAFRVDYENYNDLGGIDLNLLTFSLNHQF